MIVSDFLIAHQNICQNLWKYERKREAEQFQYLCMKESFSHFRFTLFLLYFKKSRVIKSR